MLIIYHKINELFQTIESAEDAHSENKLSRTPIYVILFFPLSVEPFVLGKNGMNYQNLWSNYYYSWIRTRARITSSLQFSSFYYFISLPNLSLTFTSLWVIVLWRSLLFLIFTALETNKSKYLGSKCRGILLAHLQLILR